MTIKGNQKAIFEANVSKIAKAMVAVVKDAKRYPDLLDENSLAKLERFMGARTGDMIRGLVLARAVKQDNTAFSLDAEPEPDVLVSKVASRPARAFPPSIPQTREEDESEIMDNSPEDDDLDATIAALEGQPNVAPPKAAPMFEVAPEPYDPTKPPKKWRPPTGRLVGTKEPVWVNTEDGTDKEAPGEKPDRTGFIREAGFLDAE